MCKLLWMGMYVLVFATIASHSVWARPYPLVTMKEDDLRVITEGEVEFDLVHDLIKQSRPGEEIRLMTYDLRADDQVGKPILKSLAEAAERGVRVKVLAAWDSRVAKDEGNWTGRYMDFLSKSMPDHFDFVSAGGPKMWERGWTLSHRPHGKIWAFSRPDRKGIGMITGRGVASEYLHWLDTAFIFDGPLVAQAVQSYDETWAILKKENPRKTESQRYKSYVPGMETFQKLVFGTYEYFGRPAKTATLEEQAELWNRYWEENPVRTEDLTRPEQKKSLRRLKRWVTRIKSRHDTGRESTSKAPFMDVRLLDNEFFQQMAGVRASNQASKKAPKNYSGDERYHLITDAIIDAMVDRIRFAKDVRIFAFALILNPKMKLALSERLMNDPEFRLQILTNSRDAHERVTPFRLPIGWKSSLGDTDDLFQVAERFGAEDRLSIHGFGYSEERPLFFSHRKVVIIDDYLYFGSSNVSEASMRQQEANVEVHSPFWAAWARREFDRDRQLNGGQAFDSDEIHEERVALFSRFLQAISRLFNTLY